MSFTLNGKTAANLNVKLKSGYDEPGSPDVRKRETSIPGKAGKYDFGSEYDVRKFELPLITLNTTTEAEVQSVIRSLVNELTDSYGDPQEVKLSFDKESDKHYLVKLDDSFGVTRHPAHFGEFKLRLVATEPFVLGAEETVTANITSSGQSTSVENEGTVKTPVVITITNNGTNTINGFELDLSS